MIYKELHDNTFEFFSEDDVVVASIHKTKVKNRILSLAKKHPDVCDVVQNADGTICAHFPLSWIKITPPREMTAEQREAARQRLLAIHQTQS